jgi:hypothetical protein
MPFTEGKMGVLMVEGTENLLAAEQSLSFDVWIKRTGVTVEEGVAVSPTGSMDADRINGLGEESGDRIIAVCLSEQSVSGRTFVFSVWLKGEGENVGKSVQVQIKRDSGTLVGAETMVTLTDEWIRCVTPPFTGLEDNMGIRAVLRRGSGDYASSCLAWRPQVEEKSYPTPWHIGGGTRANPTKRIVLPEALPDEFGIGIAFKPLHTDPGVNRRLIEIVTDPYDANNRIYFTLSDTGTGRIVFVHIKEGTALSNNVENIQEADIITGIYFHQFATGCKVYLQKSGGEIQTVDRTGLPITGLKVINVGFSVVGALVRANAVLADFVLHDRPEDIDPIGYLSQIGKPKVTAVVGEEVESIPGSQLRDGLFREIPRVFSKPVAVSIAPGVFYQEVDLGNWAAGLRVYASEDMVMFIAGREIEIPKSVLLYLPWKVRTFEVRQKSAAAVGTLYIYGGC